MLLHAGLYAWGGPGTIRLLKVKYHSPRINEASFMHLYDPDWLCEARHKLGVTDMWVTYSWGFSDETEQADRRYLVERLPGFHRNGIEAHAYVQGLNLVTSEFVDQDVFCRDAEGRLLPYSKGRSLTCPNNPRARVIIMDRVRAACQEDVSGVFVDNILFGLPPYFVRNDFTSFFGCACRYCQTSFRSQYGYSLPLNGAVGKQQLADYLDFRSRSIIALLTDLAEICQDSHKRFGVNLYDPLWHTPELYFGFRLAEIAPLLDYFLIENHALAKPGGLDNSHLLPLINSTDKPVFVVSYRYGIGHDQGYSQQDLDAIWSEAAALGYIPCLKATEYVTNGTWHALEIATVFPPVIRPLARQTRSERPRMLKRSSPVERRIVRLIDHGYSPLLTAAFENRLLAYLLSQTRIPVWLMRMKRTYLLDRSGNNI